MTKKNITYIAIYTFAAVKTNNSPNNNAPFPGKTSPLTFDNSYPASISYCFLLPPLCPGGTHYVRRHTAVMGRTRALYTDWILYRTRDQTAWFGLAAGILTGCRAQMEWNTEPGTQTSARVKYTRGSKDRCVFVCDVNLRFTYWMLTPLYIYTHSERKLSELFLIKSTEFGNGSDVYELIINRIYIQNCGFLCNLKNKLKISDDNDKNR